MGGDVSVTSTPGAGSEFTVVLSFGIVDLVVPEVPLDVSPVDAAHALRGVEILAADDSEVNLFLVKRLLELQGATVSLARNGQEAFDRIKACPSTFDLVLMDVQMPLLDGFEATRRIRQELGLADLPIIALTADALLSERQQALSAGMDDFVSKPFEPATLTKTIRRHLRGRAGSSRDRGPRSEDTLVSKEQGWPQIDGIDSTDARRRMAGDQEMLRSLLGLLLGEYPQVQGPDAEDATAPEAFAARMHKLRGTAGQVGARTIQELASIAETAARKGDVPRAADLARQIDGHLQRLRQDAASFLEASAPKTQAPSIEVAAADPQAVETLLELLHQQNLAVLDYVGSVASQLRRVMGEESYLQLRAHVAQLNFKEAARLIEAPRRAASFPPVDIAS